jgi:Right handed beta helix region
MTRKLAVVFTALVAFGSQVARAQIVKVPGFYVATNGSDSNPGTLEAPLLTLGAAQLAMRGQASSFRLRLRHREYSLRIRRLLPGFGQESCDYMKYLLQFMATLAMLAMLCSQAAYAQFYVSTNGSDTNPGTLAAPFLTLGRAQSAMQASTTKTTYVRAGSYSLSAISNCNGDGMSCGVVMTQADDGETFSYYPPDGINSASLTGGATASGDGLYTVFNVDGTSNVTINGLSINNFQYAGIVSLGGTSGLVVINNEIFNGYYVPGVLSGAAGVMCYGCADTTISNNVIYNIAAFGVVFGNVNGNISNLLIFANVIFNTCTGLADCGAIYVQDTIATATNIQWTDNYILNGNTYALLGSGYGAALYADDCTSNVTATGNVITGRNGSNTIMLHGGSNDVFSGNITDLSIYQQSVMAFQTSNESGCSNGTMSSNMFTNNIITGAGGGGGYLLLSGSPLTPPTITDNNYYNYGGSAVNSSGAYSDSNPTFANPNFTSTTTYALPSNSPVYNSPVSFPMQPANWGSAGFWGPPGFVVSPNVAATASLTASPASITSGQSSSLTWSSMNATSCTGTGFMASGTSGSASVSPTTNTTYSVTCGSASASTTVIVGFLGRQRSR